jgi:hypothetical protein
VTGVRDGRGNSESQSTVAVVRLGAPHTAGSDARCCARRFPARTHTRENEVSLQTGWVVRHGEAVVPRCLFPQCGMLVDVQPTKQQPLSNHLKNNHKISMASATRAFIVTAWHSKSGNS